MLYFLVTFIAITAINHLNPLFSPQATIHHLVNSHPSTYPHHSHLNTTSCTMSDSFPNPDLPNDDKTMRSIWCLYCIATGHKTHNTGHTTHNAGCKTNNLNTTGLVTHNTAGRATQYKWHVPSIPCCYCLMASCMTSHPNGIRSSKWHHNDTASCGTTNKLSCPSCQYHHINITLALHNLSKKTKDHFAFMQQSSEAVSAAISGSFYVLPYKHHTNDHFDQKTHKPYKSSAFTLVLAVNHSIYYLLNGTLNHTFDVNL